MFKQLIAATIVVLLAGCGKQPLEQGQTNNQEIQVDTLFTKDGCTVYRFIDYGYSIYYVNCNSGQARTSWEQQCGKGCINRKSVQTNQTGDHHD